MCRRVILRLFLGDLAKSFRKCIALLVLWTDGKDWKS